MFDLVDKLHVRNEAASSLVNFLCQLVDLAKMHALSHHAYRPSFAFSEVNPMPNVRRSITLPAGMPRIESSLTTPSAA